MLSRKEKYRIARDLGFSTKESNNIKGYSEKRFEHVLQASRTYDNLNKVKEISNYRKISDKEFSQKLGRREQYLKNRDRDLKKYTLEIEKGFFVEEAKAIQQKSKKEFRDILYTGRYEFNNRSTSKVRNIQWAKWSKRKGLPNDFVEKAQQINMELSKE